MGALNLHDIKETSRVSNKHTARETELRNTVVSTLIESSRTILDALATTDVFGDGGVMFESLELLIWIEVWVLVVKSHHQTKMNEVRTHVIHEGAGVCERIEWPSNGVLDESRFHVRGWYLPHLLQS
jgi:hypothetical protein